MNNINTRALIEAALMAVLTVGLMMLGNLPPLMILLFIASVPMAVLTARQGLAYGIGGAVVSGLLMFITMGPVMALVGFLIVAAPGVVMGEAFKLKKPMSIILLVSAVFFAVGFAGNVMLVSSGDFGDPVAVVNQTYDQIIKDLDNTTKLASIPEKELGILKEELAYSKNLTITLIPSLVVLVAGLMTLTNFSMTRLILKRTGYDLPQSRKFRDFRLPESLVPGLLIIFILTFVTGYFGYINTDTIYTNVVFLFAFLFAFQGLAVFVYFCYAIKGKDLFKVAFVILAFIINVTSTFALIGMLDAVFNLRKFYENIKTER